eukprot:4112586-Alexandrium_andersonii.AAC.1
MQYGYGPPRGQKAHRAQQGRAHRAGRHAPLQGCRPRPRASVRPPLEEDGWDEQAVLLQAGQP